MSELLLDYSVRSQKIVLFNTHTYCSNDPLSTHSYPVISIYCLRWYSLSSSLVVEVSGFNPRRAQSLKVLNQDPLYQSDVIPLCHNFIRCNKLLSCNVKKKRIFPRRMMPSERKRNNCSRHLKTEKVKITKEYTFYLQGTFRKFKIQ
jgi:hypothetical protein